MFRLCLLALLILLFVSVFYFSWLPDPSFRGLWFMPSWLSEWSDEYIDFRTAVPFFALGVGLELYIKDKGLKSRLMVLFFLFVLVCLAEAGQYLLPLRNPSLKDIFWGFAGSLSGMALGAVLGVSYKLAISYKL